MSVPDWMLSKRNLTFQFSPQLPLVLSLKQLSSEEFAENLRPRSECFISFIFASIFSLLLLSNNILCRISEEDYVSAIKEEISKVVKLQEELDIDVLVHGEPEVSLALLYIQEMHLGSHPCFLHIKEPDMIFNVSYF